MPGLQRGGCRPEALREFIESSGLKFRPGAKSWIFECPKCGKRDKLYIRRSDGAYICWYCAETIGYKGRNPEYALADLMNISVAAVKEKLYGVSAPEDGGTPWVNIKLQDFYAEIDELDEDLEIFQMQERLWPPDYYDLGQAWSQPGRQYLLGRGIDDDLIRYYHLRYDPSRERVIFPVEYQGKLYGWQARYIKPDSGVNPETGVEWRIPKILTSDPFEREKIVMFADQLDGAKQAIICEGPVDAIKCHACHPEGQPGGNVVTMGKAVSTRQIAFIRNAGIHQIYLGLDPDAAQEIPRLVQAFPDCKLFLMRPSKGAKAPDGKPAKDLGDLDLETARGAWLSAEPIRPGMIFVYLDPGGIPRWR
jgi:hypothetical protein